MQDPGTEGGVAASIRAKLERAFAPAAVDIVDESHRHAGHAGWHPGGQTHFRVKIVAAAFAGRTRVDRQRQVYAVLAEEIRGGVHALALTTLTPEEASAAGHTPAP